MEIVANVIDRNMRLIGFMGLEDETYNSMNISLMQGFSNKTQLRINNNSVSQLGNFKLHNLPLYYFEPGQAYFPLKNASSVNKLASECGFVKLDNSVEIISRISDGNELIGYRIKAMNRELRLKTIEVIRVASIFEPKNFLVRRHRNGKLFIAGRPGVEIAKFPIEYITMSTTSQSPVQHANNKQGAANTGVSLPSKTNQQPSQTQAQQQAQASVPPVPQHPSQAQPQPQAPQPSQTADALKNTATQRGRKLSKTRVDMTETHNKDILDLFEFVASEQVNGYIINFYNTSYTAQKRPAHDPTNPFISLGIGEIAAPYLTYNQSKLNVSCMFKHPGYIMVPTVPQQTDTNSGSAGSADSQPQFVYESQGVEKQLPVYTFEFRTKNIFRNGNIILDKLGIIVPEQSIPQLVAMFGRELLISEVTDQTTIQTVNRLVSWNNSKIIEVDVSRLSLFAPRKLRNITQSNVDNIITNIYENTQSLAAFKLYKTFLSGQLKAFKNYPEYAEYSKSIEPPVARQFGVFSPAELAMLEQYGINIRNGSFKHKGEPSGNSHTSFDGSDTDSDSSDNTSKEPDSYFEFIINGYNPKNINFDKIRTNYFDAQADHSMLRGAYKLIDMFNTNATLLANSGKSITELFAYYHKAIDDADKAIFKYSKELWMIRTALWVVGKGRLPDWFMQEFSPCEAKYTSRLKGKTCLYNAQYNDLFLYTLK